MNRRDFFQMAAAGALTAVGRPVIVAAKPGAKPTNLKLGTQHGDSDDVLKVMAALGVNHICAEPPSEAGASDWSVQALAQKREHIESFHLSADALRLLHPSYVVK